MSSVDIDQADAFAAGAAALPRRLTLDDILEREQLEPCASSGMCPRLVHPGVRYCCGACGDGWEATPRYEAEHTETCDQRDRERRPGALR
jgi:hypothetical protein